MLVAVFCWSYFQNCVCLLETLIYFFLSHVLVVEKSISCSVCSLLIVDRICICLLSQVRSCLSVFSVSIELIYFCLDRACLCFLYLLNLYIFALLSIYMMFSYIKVHPLYLCHTYFIFSFIDSSSWVTHTTKLGNCHDKC